MTKPTTVLQEDLLDPLDLVDAIAPDAPAWQRRVHGFIYHPVVQWFVVAVILLNAVAIGLQTFDLPPDVNRWVEALDQCFLTVFVVELVLRFLAAGARPSRFLANRWNVFDTLVIGAAWLPLLVPDTTLLRLLRVLRIARLGRVMPDIAVLFDGLRRASRPAASLLALTTLMCFLYGMLGHLLFGRSQPEHFGNIFRSMLTLVELLTLEGWNETLHELMATDGVVALVYTIGFVMFGTYIVINLLVGVVISSLDDAYDEQRRRRSADRDLRASLDELDDLVARLRAGVADLEEREARLAHRERRVEAASTTRDAQATSTGPASAH